MFSQKMMDEAIHHARSNPIVPRGRTSIGRMGALITNGEVGAYGQNSYKTHPLARKFSGDDNRICLHAELAALIRFQSRFVKPFEFDMKDFDIYVARVLKNNTPALAKPCNACMGALRYFNIRDIYWTQ